MCTRVTRIHGSRYTYEYEFTLYSRVLARTDTTRVVPPQGPALTMPLVAGNQRNGRTPWPTLPVELKAVSMQLHTQQTGRYSLLSSGTGQYIVSMVTAAGLITGAC